jgi:hypothetical protein
MSWVVEHLHRDGSVLARVPVQSERFTIGRALDNDLVLDDVHTAPLHAALSFHGHHRALLKDLGSLNGIARQRGKKCPEIPITDDQPLRVGASWIRVRSSAWALAPELPLPTRHVWIWALLALMVVLAHAIWEVWLTDRQSESPPYLYAVAGIAGVITLWSAAYALYGRLANGADRFFNHLLIACCGYLCLTVLDNLLPTLGFVSGWVWPLQWLPYVLGLGVALTVRAHLRTADPRHWPTSRWGLALVTVVAMTVPLAQQWITHKELTSTHTMDVVTYPALRWAKPIAVDSFLEDVQSLKGRSDAARNVSADDGGDDEEE